MLGICCLRMPLEDFVSNFTELIICRLFNTNIFTVSRTWREMVIKGNWSVGVKGTSQDRSGGGPTFTDTYLRNPQVYKHFLFDCGFLGFYSTAGGSLYSGMWHCVTGWLVYYISRQCGGFIFKGHIDVFHLTFWPLKMRQPWCLELSDTSHPVMWWCIPWDSFLLSCYLLFLVLLGLHTFIVERWDSDCLQSTFYSLKHLDHVGLLGSKYTLIVFTVWCDTGRTGYLVILPTCCLWISGECYSILLIDTGSNMWLVNTWSFAAV